MNELKRNCNISSKCTVCCKITEEIYQHELLKVIICKTCFGDFYGSSSTRNVENLCFWCMKNRELLQCVQCKYKCCYDCINTNLGADYMNCLNEKNWLCFICDSDPIEDLQKDFIQLFNKSLKSDTEALTPEGTSSSINIISPFVSVEETEEMSKKPTGSHRINGLSDSQDLDLILNTYEKQIQACLELEDANVPTIINEINSIKTEQLTSAIHSFKKCLSAFSSDLINLETRVNQAKANNNQATLIKLTSLLRILIQHHIFNRLSHPKARIQDDQKQLSVPGINNCKNINSHSAAISSTNNSKQMLLIMNHKYLKEPKNVQVALDKIERSSKSSSHDLSLNDLSNIIKSHAQNGSTKNVNKIDGTRRYSMNLDRYPSSPKYSSKKQRLFDEDSVEMKSDRVRRSLTTPSWLSDFKVEKESESTEIDESDDHEWTDYRVKDSTLPRKRGRPPKLMQYSHISDFDMDSFEAPKRGRGRPKKFFNLNDKQPRYYIQKLNGETLQTVDD